ncbi:MAG: hypothetical protein ABSE71_01895 [Candidatus Micrarchaeaceae archaeon]|jgi:HSP20 family protein|nr:Hsp20/alpha crystallin family protein [Candidatus Micrarchaeota archaeon]HII10425.1 Hsp20/alpha crystallin family protein [Candidatus Micrarchaeota archaeon]
MNDDRNDPASLNRDLNSSFAISRSKSDVAMDKLQKPFVEVIESRDRIVVLVEIHGYKSSEIKVGTDGSRLNINASSAESSWIGNITLPTAVDPAGSEARYNHGTLEVTLRKGYYNGNRLVLIELI